MVETRQENFLEKPLPSNEEAERVILGLVLLYPDKYLPTVMQHLTPEDFYSPRHRKYYELMLALNGANIEIDAINIYEEVKRQGHSLDALGGMSALGDMAFGLPPLSDPEYLKKIEIVKKAAASRKLLFTCARVEREILTGFYDIADTAQEAESEIIQINSKLYAENVAKAITNGKRPSDVIDEMAAQFTRFQQGISTGVRTGMAPIDNMLDGGGLQPDALYVVAGAEKSGKTSLVLDWAYNIAVVQGFTVLIVTLEMSALTMMKRLYSAHSGVPYYTFRPGMYGKYFEDAMAGLKEFATLPIEVTDNLYGLYAIIRYLNRRVNQTIKGVPPVGAVVIDYMQLIINDDPNFRGNETAEVATTSRELKKLSGMLGVPVIVISSLNRVGLTEGQEPDAHNLRGSGSIGFDAEALMFIHNPLFHPGKPYIPKDVTDMTFIMSRQRNGPTGRELLKFIGKFMQFMTEADFRKAFGDTAVDKDGPKSTGQMVQESKDLEAMWEQHEPDPHIWKTEDDDL